MNILNVSELYASKWWIYVFYCNFFLKDVNEEGYAEVTSLVCKRENGGSEKERGSGTLQRGNPFS